MPESADPIVVALGGLYLWWVVAAVVGVMRSTRSTKGKALWIVALVLLSPIGLIAYVLRGRRRSRARHLGVTGYISIATLGALAMLASTRELWRGYEHAAWIVAWGLVTFVVYAIDKRAARAGKDDRGGSKRSRVDELALHLLAVVGGFVGGWVGRHGLRHKTRKPMFAVVLVLATALHLSALLGLW
ncbi:MAG: DUF1294 domain-containing protein [Deltaproteobacteria bacterium]|nr:DUF1294 domain-containing protein [Deltaproteobacteria bacterium]